MDDRTLNLLKKLSNDATAAFESAQYTVAAEDYRRAIVHCQSTLVQLHVSRANALVSALNYADALIAAEQALKLDGKQPKAWYLKGIALYHTDRHQEAKQPFLTAARLEADLNVKSSYTDWAHRCDKPVQPPNDAPPAKPKDEPKDNMRMQWYQSLSHVTLDIYAKDVLHDKSIVQFERNRLSLTLCRPDLPDYSLDLDLAQGIEVSASSWNVGRVKVEIRLKKAPPTCKWSSLDKHGNVVSAVVEAGQLSRQRREAVVQRQKGLDSLAEKELKDAAEGDPMELFRTIYKDADDDARRAMMKSYSESGGQVLSTNWNEVKTKKVTYEGDDK